MKALIIGLDGATLDLIKPWVADGELPTFGKIMNESSYGILRSTIPPTTIPAWISLGTGKNPGKHGLYYMFHLTKNKEIKPTPPILKDYGFFWTKLAREWEVGLLNIPFIRTKLENGFCVPGRLPLDPYPKEMKNMLPAWQDLTPDWSKGEDYNLKVLYTMVENQTKNIKYVLKNWDLDLLFAFYVATDTIQHFFWGYMDKSHTLYKKTKYENAILNLYKKIDSDINEILEIVGEKTNLFILSDHGFQPYEYSIPINYWLKEQGYLRLRKGKGRKFYLSRLLKKSYELVEGSWAEKLIPPEVKSKAVYSFLPKIDEVIDWDASRAYAPTDGGGIYVEDGGTRDELIEKLQEIKNPYTGEKAIRKVYRKEEVYSGEYLDQAPDLLAVPQRRAWITCRLGYSSTVIKRPSILSGSGIHARDGILIARGPDIKGGEEIKADITDIAPTVLRLFGEEIPKEIDGRALEEIFR